MKKAEQFYLQTQTEQIFGAVVVSSFHRELFSKSFNNALHLNTQNAITVCSSYKASCLIPVMNMGKFLIYLAKVVVGYVSFQIFDLPKSVPPLQNVLLNDFENKKKNNLQQYPKRLFVL